ncbi:MAG: D-alanyl-D-alanine carboxypeptidase family protein [Alphaproteobacteria bacterium]
MKTVLLKPFYLLFSLLILCSFSTDAHALVTPAKQAILIDADTGAVIFEKNADAKMYPASMTKVMTAYLAFERLKEKSFTLDSNFSVSRKAWAKKGSKMFLLEGTQVTFGDLIRGLVIQSGNDAAIALAEGIAGDEDSFGEMMTDKAKALGMKNTVFKNATGWPDKEHYTTAKDMALLAIHIIRDFPEYYPYFSEEEFTYAKIRQPNRNRLLGNVVGADGLKTGHTEISGYGMVGSAKRDGRRLVIVVHGLTSESQRAAEAGRLLNWGFQNFKNKTLFKKDTVIHQANVWGGSSSTVPLVLKKDLNIPIKRDTDEKKITAEIYILDPIPAPIAKGKAIGKMIISVPDMKKIGVSVYAGEAVERAGFFGRVWHNLIHIF